MLCLRPLMLICAGIYGCVYTASACPCLPSVLYPCLPCLSVPLIHPYLARRPTTNHHTYQTNQTHTSGGCHRDGDAGGLRRKALQRVHAGAEGHPCLGLGAGAGIYSDFCASACMVVCSSEGDGGRLSFSFPHCPHPNNTIPQGNAASLRDRAIECVGVVGAAVGRSLFAPDAVEVMDLLVGQLQVRAISKRFGLCVCLLLPWFGVCDPLSTCGEKGR